MVTSVSLDCVQITGAIPIQNILRLEVSAQVNEHAKMWVRGIVSEENAKEWAGQPLAGKEMTLLCDFETKRPFFCGQILKARFFVQSGLTMVDVLCVSGSLG